MHAWDICPAAGTAQASSLQLQLQKYTTQHQQNMRTDVRERCNTIVKDKHSSKLLDTYVETKLILTLRENSS